MKVFDYFDEIRKIPRESGNEEGIRAFLLSWAEKNGLKAVKDGSGNIIVYGEATKGFENVPPLAIQSHMDMVCVKTSDSNHDFAKDPIDTYIDGDYLRAKGTSLGADNGIGMALAMALLTDPSVQHGPLEAVFTYSEETGMFGAFSLDGSLLKSRRMLNVDSEEEGIFYIGCAGGLEIDGKYQASVMPVPEDWEPVEISLSGFKGGHSGAEIHHERGNAISAMFRMLCSTEKLGPCFMLSEVDGGTRKNVIPSEIRCVICVPSATKKTVMHTLTACFDEIREEYKFQDPDIRFDHHCSHCNPDLARPEKAVSPAESLKLAKAIFALPHGVYSSSKAVPGIVETSDNLAIVTLRNGEMKVAISVRSLVESAKYMLVSRIRIMLEVFGFECDENNEYPSWAPDPDSALARDCAKAWKECTGEDAVVTSLHAGLECGVVNSRIKGMDSVSFGPDLFDVHSVNEHLSISSTEKIYGFLKYLLSI